jgi:DNA-binding transcriptional LysR family regulator
MLNLERLRALHTVANRGSVSAAAQALHVTNSAISQQLAKLEEEVGQTLLERNGRGVRLTDAATLLVSHTARVLSALELAEAELDAHRSAVAGRLTIAAFPTAVRGLAPRALQRLTTQHPQLEVVLREQEPQESIPLLVKGDVDLVIAQDWANAPLALPEGLSRAPLLEDLADVALPKTHPLAKRASLSLTELAGARWISWHPGTICHDWLVHTLRSLGHEPTVTHTAAEHGTQLALVAAGLGVAVIPRLGREPVPSTVRIVRVKPALERYVYALWRTGTSRRHAVRAGVAAFELSATKGQS